MQDAARRKRYSHIFFPHYAEERDRFESSGRRFIYYTNASTASLILKHREIWMRSSGVMNDYSEVKHGLHCLNEALQSPEGARWGEALDECFPGAKREILRRFYEWQPMIEWDTFVACFSEHDVVTEPYGRLSMWRAYGGDNGVALVVKPDVFFSQVSPLAAYCSPVAYLDAAGVKMEIDRIASRIRENIDFVKSFDRDGVVNTVFHALRFAAICTKHPAFKEEKEWRIVACPSMETSKHVETSIEVIGGVPQPILHIALKDYPGTGMPSLSPVEFVEKILVGPNQYPSATIRALGELLHQCGRPNPYDYIESTNIPLRPNQR